MLFNIIYFYNIFLPAFIIVNLLNVFALVYSFYLYKNNINGYIHKNQKREHLPKYLPRYFFCLILQNIMIFGLYFIEKSFIISKQFYFYNIFEAFFIYFIDDMYFYFFHRILHTVPYLYVNIHKKHHEAHSPYPINYSYAHPIEILFGTIGTFFAIFILKKVYTFGFFLYLFIKLYHEIVIHTGIKNTFILFKFIPFIGKTEDHDIHHYYLNGNYGSSLNYLDKLFGTYITNNYIE